MIFLALAPQTPARLRESLPAGTPWVFLADDYPRLLCWETELGVTHARLDIAQQLAAIASDLRPAFLRWIEEAGVHEPPLVWWSSRLAEANTYSNGLFLQCCYLQMVRRLTREYPSLLVVAEDPSLLEAIRLQCGPCQWFCRCRVLLDWALYPLRLVWHVLAHVRCCWRERWAARRSRSQQDDSDQFRSGAPTILLHTWIDESYFVSADGGERQDRYFPGLAEWLLGQGQKVAVLPTLGNVVDYGRAVSRLRRLKVPHVIAEDCWCLSDYLHSALVIIRDVFLLPKPSPIDGLIVDPMVRAVCRRSSLELTNARFVRYHDLMRRLAARDWRLQLFVDCFEGMLSERPPILGLRKFMSGCRTVGYQHNMVPPRNLLCAVAHPNHPEILPDRLVVCSRWMRQLMIRAGFPEKLLVTGPSLRYAHLLTAQLSHLQTTVPGLLVLLPLDRGAALEVLCRLARLLPLLPDFPVTVKPHPMMPQEELGQLLRCVHLPRKVADAPGALAGYLDQAFAVLVTSSTSATEIGLAGVPVGVLGRETTLTLDPLEWFDDVPRTLCSDADVTSFVAETAENPQKARDVWTRWATKHRGELLSPVNAQTMAAFLDPGLETDATPGTL